MEQMDADETNVVVVDTSVLINFLHLGRLDVLDELPFRFLIPEEVRGEVDGDEYPEQERKLNQALEYEILELITVTEASITNQIARYTETFGKGESACLALAEAKSCGIACDDTRAVRVARNTNAISPLLNTVGVIVMLIDENVVNRETAQKWKGVLDENSFYIQKDFKG